MTTESKPDSGFVTTTRGIHINVKPEYSEENSNPETAAYVYRYTIRVFNKGSETVQLISRHWIIRDGFDRIEHVVGEGVVGQKPVIGPGETFEYSSFCPLPTPTGSMQGSFQMKDGTGQSFEAFIGEFKLNHPSLVN